MPAAALSTAPVSVDARLTWLIYLGWVIPALTVAAAKTWIIHWRPAEAAPTILLTTALYLAWIALTALPRWRGLLIDVGRLLLAEVSVVGVPYLETSAAYVGDVTSYWTGRHWNEKGQEAIAQLLSRALRSYL